MAKVTLSAGNLAIRALFCLNFTRQQTIDAAPQCNRRLIINKENTDYTEIMILI